MAAKSNEKNLVFQLRCEVQKYAWGKIGGTSAVAQLAKSADDNFNLEADSPYAELWMGTHPNGPSTALIPGVGEVTLDDWLKQNPDKLGESVNKAFKGQLPFLFKVLSVKTALSIQAHPNKVRAEQLHNDFPDMYKDANHKPEMAIALTDFKGLCGFRPVLEIAEFLQSIEEFRVVVGSNNATKLIAASKSNEMPLQRELIKACFTAMMTQDKNIVGTQLRTLVDRVKAKEKHGEDTSKFVGDVLLKLDKEFPRDVGGFSIYFLNVVSLQPGEAMFLEANLPHCYLSGDCMECMACSDNVVRAGLTPKKIDVETLLKMLDYSGRPVAKTKFVGKTKKEDGCQVITFRPPIWDFAVTQIHVPTTISCCRLPGMDSASIVICIHGNGELINRSVEQPIQVKRGTVVFISANEEATLNTQGGDMLLFRAHAG